MRETVIELTILVLAALLELSGDALVRWGMQTGKAVAFALGTLALFSYGLTVNWPGWNFGRLFGVYIAVFFVVSQLMAHFIYHERAKVPTLVGGALIVAGGLIIAFWRVK
jgi:drug/metabolite transporter superfamily protein YnfA